MNTVNHALWGATIGRVVGRPIEGAILGALPDAFNLPLGWYWLVKKKRPETAPKWMKKLYEASHNWLFAFLVTGVAFYYSRVIGILFLAYCWHIIEDAFFHTKMAIPFLWPIWKGKFAKYSAQEHTWVQIIDLAGIVLVNIFISLH